MPSAIRDDERMALLSLNAAILDGLKAMADRVGGRLQVDDSVEGVFSVTLRQDPPAPSVLVRSARGHVKVVSGGVATEFFPVPVVAGEILEGVLDHVESLLADGEPVRPR